MTLIAVRSWAAVGFLSLGCTVNITEDAQRDVASGGADTVTTVDEATSNTGSETGGATSKAGASGTDSANTAGSAGTTDSVTLAGAAGANDDDSEANLVCPPVPTELVQIQANLDVRNVTPPLPWNVEDPEDTSNGGFSFDVLDSLGKPHSLELYVRNQGANLWQYDVLAIGNEIAPELNRQRLEVATGQLTFDTNGVLPMDDPGSTFTVSFLGATKDQPIELRFAPLSLGTGSQYAGTTQYAAAQTLYSIAVSGSPAASGASCVERSLISVDGPLPFDLPGYDPPEVPEQGPSLCLPVPTSRITITANLDAEENVPTEDWSDTDPSNRSNFSTSMNIYDSLGSSHTLDLYFRKTGDDLWSWYALVPGNEITGGTPGANFTVGEGTLDYTFSNGALTVLVADPLQVDFAGATPGQVIVLYFGTSLSEGGDGLDGITQYAARSSVSAQSQDGCYAHEAPCGVCPGDW